MTVFTYRVFYRFEHDDVEYFVLIEETSEQNARNALMSREPITITRVEVVGGIGTFSDDYALDADDMPRLLCAACTREVDEPFVHCPHCGARWIAEGITLTVARR